jgi:hypothetical protein
MSAGNLCSGSFGDDLGTGVDLADLADNTNGGHLRWWYLGVPPHPMTPQFYWLVAAPGLMAGLSAVGWLALWLTRPKRKDADAAAQNQMALPLT